MVAFWPNIFTLRIVLIYHPVVIKVRGNAGERHSWAPKNYSPAFPGPT